MAAAATAAFFCPGQRRWVPSILLLVEQAASGVMVMAAELSSATVIARGGRSLCEMNQHCYAVLEVEQTEGRHRSSKGRRRRVLIVTVDAPRW